MYLKENKTKHRILKNTIISLFILSTIWFSFGLYLKLSNNHKNKLESIGYSNIEISIIEDILNIKDIKKLYNYDYITQLTDLLIDKNYDNKKISNYLEYYQKYPDINNNDLIYLINNQLDNFEYNSFNMQLIHDENFDMDNIERYNDYYQKYHLSINDTIYAVNNNYDKYNIKYNKKYLKYSNEDLCILANLERYYKYSLKHKNKSTKEIISSVNNNLDLKPYEDVTKADINKNETILVNKYYYLDSDYEPNDLVDIDSTMGKGKLQANTYQAFQEMYNNALKDKIKLYITRGYISYTEQEILYYNNKYYYEKPGYSESQTGLSFEIVNNSWLKKHAYEYGFILRYPKDKQTFTGYYKSNYYRYVGKEIAEFLHNNDMTYDEYYAYFIKSNNKGLSN